MITVELCDSSSYFKIFHLNCKFGNYICIILKCDKKCIALSWEKCACFLFTVLLWTYILSKMQLYMTDVDVGTDTMCLWTRLECKWGHVLYAFFGWQDDDWIWPSHPSYLLCLAGRWHDQPVLVPKAWEGLKLIEAAGGRCENSGDHLAESMKSCHIGDDGDTISLRCPTMIPTLIYVPAGKDVGYSILASLFKDWSCQWKVGWLVVLCTLNIPFWISTNLIDFRHPRKSK